MERIHTFLCEHCASLVFIAVVLLSVYASQVLVFDVSSVISENRLLSALTLSVLMFGATVVAPITVLPMVPLVAPILGPLTTGLAAWIGWTLGSVVAFWIARYGGKPLLARFVSMEKIAQYEKRIPEKAHFFLILALRLILPVDVLSYALGLFSNVKIGVYTLASTLGILWFSFAFSFLGFAAYREDTVLFVAYGVASLIIFLGAYWYVRRALKKEENT